MKKETKGNKINCVVTGKQLYLNAEYYTEKVNQFEGENNLVMYYISKEVKSLLSKGYSIEECRKTLTAPDDMNIISEENLRGIFKYNGINIGLRGKDSLTSISSFTYNETDPEVKEFIDRINE